MHVQTVGNRHNLHFSFAVLAFGWLDDSWILVQLALMELGVWSRGKLLDLCRSLLELYHFKCTFMESLFDFTYIGFFKRQWWKNCCYTAKDPNHIETRMLKQTFWLLENTTQPHSRGGVCSHNRHICELIGWLCLRFWLIPTKLFKEKVTEVSKTDSVCVINFSDLGAWKLATFLKNLSELI